MLFDAGLPNLGEDIVPHTPTHFSPFTAVHGNQKRPKRDSASQNIQC